MPDPIKKLSWDNQQAKVKAEKDAKLKLLLKQEGDIVQKLIDQKGKTKEPIKAQDATKVRTNNRPELFSKVARNKTDKEIAEERKYLREEVTKSPLNTDFFNLNSHTRENWATGAKGLESQFRVSDKPNFFDDYVNPANMIGNMASNLGQSPLQAQQSDSILPYVTSVGMPLAVGAMAGLGTQNTGQFVNNLANPLAGFGLKDRALDAVRIGKEIIQNPKVIIKEAVKDIKKLPNQAEQVYHTFRDRNKPLYKIGSDNLENALESKIKNLQTEEGFNRLVNQELEITRNINPYSRERDLIEKANKNANARIDELSQTENLNKSFLNAKLENPNINVNPFLDFGIPKNNAYFRGDYNNAINLDFLKKVNKDFVLDEGAIKPGKIAIGREYAEDIGVYDHEINHALQNGRQTKIDKDIIEHFSNLENRREGLVSKKRSSDVDEAALSYLLTGSKGKEPSSFLAEARQAMLNKNLIKDIYEPITPEIVEKSMNYFSKNPIKNKYTKSSSTRIFDIANKNSAEFLANQMNKLPAIVPIAGATYLGTQENNKQTSQFALGGNLKQQTNNNMLNQFNEGGTHEQNPNGGIPQGPNATVEQGETSTKTPNGKYIYSNRLYINEDLVKQFNLPNSIKGKTFADASKIIDKPFKDRNSNPDKLTHKEHLDRLKQAQETLKQQEQQRAEQIAQSMQSNQQEVPDMMNGQIPEGMEEFTEQPDQNQMFLGGNFNLAEAANMTGGLSGIAGKASPYLNLSSNKIKKFEDGGEIDSDELSTQDYLGAATGLASLGALSQGVGASSSKFGSAFSGAATGAQAGMAFGPWGAGIGAAVGLGAGLLGANKAQKQQSVNLRNNANSANLTDNFAFGGKIKQFGGGGPVPLDDSLDGYEGQNKINMNYNDIMFKPTNTIPQTDAKNLKSNKLINNNYGPQVKPDAPDYMKNYEQTPPLFPNSPYIEPQGLQINDLSENNGYFDKSIAPNPNTTNQGINPNKFSIGDGLNKVGDYLDKNGGKFLKYAPVAMNAYQLAKLTKPENQHLQRLSDKYKTQHVDEAQLQNIANQEMTNTINGISQSGASQGAIRSSILGAGLNKTKALSDAYMKANAENRATDDKGQTFNLGVNQFNTQTQHQESENWERNKAAYDTEKSRLLGNIGENLGNIGKEEVNKNQIAEALGYEWDGEYHINKKTGEKLTTDEMKNKIDNLKNNKTYNFKGKDFSNTSVNYTPTNFKIGRI